ncbi:MAG TPA: site-specific integrase, partial [Tepidisphaeraceae bacterium]
MNTATVQAPAAPNAAASSKSSSAPTKIFTPLVAQFLEYLKLERHFSDYTVKSYGADLQQFGQYLAGEIGRP